MSLAKFDKISTKVSILPDGGMVSLTGWTWVWASSGSWWWAGKPGMLQCMGSHSQTRLSNWTELKITADGNCRHEIKRCLLFGRKVMTNLDNILKNRDLTLSTKVHLVKAMASPVVMNGCENRTIKKAECWRIDAFELWSWRRLERLLDCNDIKPIHPKGNQSWIFIGRNDAEAEAPILWPPDSKNWLIWKDPDTGQNWRQEEKGTIEDEMVG